LNTDIVTIIFSRNRALQLDLNLNGFYKANEDTDLPEIKIIYTYDAEHALSYQILQAEHPYPEFIKENNFKADLLNALKDKKQVLFLVDDTLFCGTFSIEKIIKLLEIHKNALGCSLRLGKNTHYCYPLNAHQPIPPIKYIEENFVIYDWTQAQLDFAYALEVSSSLYQTKDILPILKNNNFSNPNSLESVLYANLNRFIRKPYLMCFNKSKAFSNPANRVQKTALTNRYSMKDKYNSSELLLLYEEGFRVDYSKFFNVVPNGCHMEIDL